MLRKTISYFFREEKNNTQAIEIELDEIRSSDPDTVTTLPEDCIKVIYSYLDLRSLERSLLVNKKIYKNPNEYTRDPYSKLRLDSRFRAALIFGSERYLCYPHSFFSRLSPSSGRRAEFVRYIAFRLKKAEQQQNPYAIYILAQAILNMKNSKLVDDFILPFINQRILLNEPHVGTKYAIDRIKKEIHNLLTSTAPQSSSPEEVAARVGFITDYFDTLSLLIEEAFQHVIQVAFVSIKELVKEYPLKSFLDELAVLSPDSLIERFPNFRNNKQAIIEELKSISFCKYNPVMQM